MTGPSTISANPPTNKGLDYSYLRTEGVRLVQQLSGDIWTDYNEHDPGVTTLEQLCYALTELSYRAELPVADMLADPKTGRIHPYRHGLFTARHILPCNPVTCDDYTRLIADRIPEIGNAWLTPHVPKAGSKAVNGLYDMRVYAPDAYRHHHHYDCGPDPDSELRERLLRRVRRVYRAHRNLCEDLHSVHILLPLPAAMYADVSVCGKTPVEKILAEILFRLGNLFAPELQRQPLNALLDAGQCPDQIFNGPLLRRGFIEDNQLQPQMTSLAVNDAIRVIAQTDAVVAVRSVEVRTTDRHSGDTTHAYGPNDSVSIPSERVLRLLTDPGPDGRSFTIRMLRNGVVCYPDPATFRLELSLLWAGYRRSYPLEVQYAEYFGTPRGRKLDLERYYSIQNQYPTIYGISAYGLPPEPTTVRRAQAKQLKGYLLPFEQLMADYCAQLANARELFSIKPDSWRTYYCQSLAKSVPDVAPLLSQHYFEGLNAIVSSEDTIVARRSHFLGYLLSLYANELNSTAQDDQCHPQTRLTERLLRARLAFLHVLAPSTRRRGRAFNYRARLSPFNVAGMEMKCRIQMGLDLERHTTLSDALAQSETKLVRGAEERPGSRGRQLSPIEENFRPLAAYAEPPGVPESSALLRGNSVTGEFIRDAQDPANLFVGKLPGDDSVAIAHKKTADCSWDILDVFPDLESALREAHALWRHLKKIERARTQLYIVEHPLLRFGKRKRHPDDGTFGYSFTLTAVVGLPSSEPANPNNRCMVEQIVRENTPAHIVSEVCFLDSCRLLKFEDIYQRWREALRKGKFSRVAESSARLRRFLERHAGTNCHPGPD